MFPLPHQLTSPCYPSHTAQNTAPPGPAQEDINTLWWTLVNSSAPPPPLDTSFRLLLLLPPPTSAKPSSCIDFMFGLPTLIFMQVHGSYCCFLHLCTTVGGKENCLWQLQHRDVAKCPCSQAPALACWYPTFCTALLYNPITNDNNRRIKKKSISIYVHLSWKVSSCVLILLYNKEWNAVAALIRYEAHWKIRKLVWYDFIKKNKKTWISRNMSEIL